MKNLQLEVKLSAIDKLTAPFKNTAKATKTLSNSLNKNRKILNELKKAQERVSKLKLSGAETRLKQKIEETTQAIKRQREEFEKLNKVKARQMEYRNSVEKLKNNSQRLQNIGQRALLTGGAFSATGMVMIKPAIDFEQSFSKVQALTRLDKTKSEDAVKIKNLREQAIELGGSTAFTAAEVANAQGYLAMAGFNAEQIQASMKAVLNMSQASGADLARVSDVASDISSGFKITADQMGRVADVLTMTFTTSNTSLETLYETMKEAAPIMTGMGQSFESTAAMSGLLGNVGIKGSNAGTTLKNIGLNLIDNKHLKKLGVKTTDKLGNMRAIPEILAEIKRKTDQFGTGKRAQIINDIFGRIPIAGAMELISQADSALQNYENSLKDAAGTVEKVSSIMTDNLAGDIKNLSSAKEALGISVYDSISTTLRELTQQFTGVLRKVNEWVKANPELTAKIVKWGGAIAGSLTVLGALSMAMSFLLYPISRLILGFGHFTLLTDLFSANLVKAGVKAKGVSNIVMSWRGLIRLCNRFIYSLKFIVKGIISLWNPMTYLRGAIKLITGSFSGLIRILSFLKFAFISNPIGLLVTALVTGAVLIYKYWDQVRAFFGGFWQGLKNGMAPVLEKFKPLGDMFGVVVGWIEKAVKWFTDLLSPVQSASEDLDKAASAGYKFGEWLAKGIDLVTKPLQWVIDSIKWVIDNMPSLDNIISKDHAQQISKTADMAAMTGFASGGYTGNGGRYDPAGIVHRGEFVFNKSATSRLGTGFLSTLHNAKSARAGMLAVGLSAGIANAQPLKIDNRAPLSARGATVASAPMTVNITINAGASQNADDIARAVQRELARIENQRQARNRSRLADRD